MAYISALRMQRLVETAMLAAVSGLSYALAATMHLEGYIGYFLPLPVVLAAMRGGATAGRKTVTATFFLLLGTPPTSFDPMFPLMMRCRSLGKGYVLGCK